jgi:hypothetical protein
LDFGPAIVADDSSMLSPDVSALDHLPVRRDNMSQSGVLVPADSADNLYMLSKLQVTLELLGQVLDWMVVSGCETTRH